MSLPAPTGYSDEELWACAASLLQRWGAHTGQFLADRILLVPVDDRNQLLAWMSIEQRVQELSGLPPPPRLH
ncbi:hypothetical protein [Sphingomonas quercus]|uniref:Uncharacterized protein n=1 Tax=Sphingomonas quercus TaxID=2842451 RepID=A0ABS6BK14_9SPHN|nr:hypothetical protein [Sphingomonas quercus]MBU3077560.1 hypothetical protein [Sphingomonas quercus]